MKNEKKSPRQRTVKNRPAQVDSPAVIRTTDESVDLEEIKTLLQNLHTGTRGILSLEYYLSSRTNILCSEQDDLLSRWEVFQSSSHWVEIRHEGRVFSVFAHKDKLLTVGSNPTKSLLRLLREHLLSLLPVIGLEGNKPRTIRKNCLENVPEGLGFENLFLYSIDRERSRHALGFARAISVSLNVLSLPLYHAAFTKNRKEIVVKNSFPFLSVYLNAYECLGTVRRSYPTEVPELLFTKVIKNSLSNFFSKIAYESHESLDMHVQFEPSFEVVPPKYYFLLRKKILEEVGSDDARAAYLRLGFMFLQSKKICEPVGVECIHRAFLDHQRTVCPEVVDFHLSTSFRDSLSDVGREFGKLVKQVYEPHQTRCPNRMATFETPRRSGGCYQELLNKGQLIDFNDPNSEFLKKLPRPEPLVIGIFGPPKSGKSTNVCRIVNYLRGVLKVPDSYEYNQVVYSRSSHLKHWDGYCHQPIVIIDDFAQDLSCVEDVREFNILVSQNPYYLPMARLEDKGVLFTSKILIVTSNKRFGSVVSSPDRTPVILENMSLWRRFHFPLNLIPVGFCSSSSREDQDCWDLDTSSSQLRLISPLWGRTANYRLQGWSTVESSSDYHPKQGPTLSIEFKDEPIEWNELFLRIAKIIPIRFGQYLENCGYWVQKLDSCSFKLHPNTFRETCDPEFVGYDTTTSVVASIGDYESDLCFCKVLVFPKVPPLSPPRCRVSAVSEPLKVRTITVGESCNSCLKPLQMAFHTALGFYPEFSLTHGVDPDSMWGDQEPLYGVPAIEAAVNSRLLPFLDGDKYLLSGDYASATDNIPLVVTQVLLTAILEEVNHPMTSEWALWATSPSHITYPAGIPGVSQAAVQASGQLMGGILSFPLLCLVNLCLCRMAGIDRCLINGDDLAAVVNEDSLKQWCRLGPLLGLTPSPGKFFVSRDFVTINSQLTYMDKFEKLSGVGKLGRILQTGKLSLIYRRDLPLAETLYDLQFFYPQETVRELYIRRNPNLNSTLRSPYVPRSWGGLARKFKVLSKGFGGFNLYQALQVYSAILVQRFFPDPVRIPKTPFSVVEIPCNFGNIDVIKKFIARDSRTVRILLNAIRPDKPLNVDLHSKSEEDLTMGQFQILHDRSIKLGIWDHIKKKKRLSALPVLESYDSSYVIVKTAIASRVQKIAAQALGEFLGSPSPSILCVGDDIFGSQLLDLESEISNFEKRSLGVTEPLTFGDDAIEKTNFLDLLRTAYREPTVTFDDYSLPTVDEVGERGEEEEEAEPDV